MPADTLSYASTGYFSKLVVDYLGQEPALRPFYNRYPEIENFRDQAAEKAGRFSLDKRKLLVSRLQEQNKELELSPKTKTHILQLKEKNCFTVTTGHQLNLFTGPLYFFYKILSVIKLSEQLNNQYSDINVVPVFWMATEDHDLEEINFFNFRGQKVRWDQRPGGAVGRLDNKGMERVTQSLRKVFGDGERSSELLELFEAAYLKHRSLASATRYLVNSLFGEHGLVIVDGDDSELKTCFTQVVHEELDSHSAFERLNQTTAQLASAGYSKQVHPREINLFYLAPSGRHRIIRDGDSFFLDGTHQVFSAEKIKAELEVHPERFSPNALLRPLYQEMVLPNLCYIGGGGELAYWFQLKSCFEYFEVTFPMLMLRNSLLIVSKKQWSKLEKLERSVSDLFLSPIELEDKHGKAISNIDIDLNPQREHLKKQFEDLYNLAKLTDSSFEGAVAAQEKKQLNGLDKLEKRLLKAQKRKLADQINRLTDLQEGLFPSGTLQERHKNFSEFYLDYGSEMLTWLHRDIDPLRQEFTILCW